MVQEENEERLAECKELLHRLRVARIFEKASEAGEYDAESLLDWLSECIDADRQPSVTTKYGGKVFPNEAVRLTCRRPPSGFTTFWMRHSPEVHEEVLGRGWRALLELLKAKP